MTDHHETTQDGGSLVLEYELDATPEKVRRALTVPELRERWLPSRVLVDQQPVVSADGEEVSYRMRDAEPPFIESTVTFQIRPHPAGGTRFTIVQQALDARQMRQTDAANVNRPPLMRAA
ncbi:SRPBCC family protein [Consotaella aegiceratis]|uniref:SRPBCC family protein n=1 Tax=Consotaella aegiceratis TaxID=3097961 RepID=UPI002F40E28B